MLSSVIRTLGAATTSSTRALCTRTATAQSSSGSVAWIKRFYDSVSIIQSDTRMPDGRPSYEVCLDRRRLRTPMSKIGSEPLALAVAQEWREQSSDRIRQDTMRLTGMCITAADNPLKLTAVRFEPATIGGSCNDIVAKMLDYLDTDTIFFIADQPEKLRAMQIAEWGSIVEWCRHTYGLDVRPSDSICVVPEISEKSREALRSHLACYSFESLIGYQYVVESLKSVVLGMALVAGRVDVDQAVRLSCLEQLYQSSVWGSVEWAHDIEHADLKSRAAAGTLVVYLNAHTSHTVDTEDVDGSRHLAT